MRERKYVKFRTDMYEDTKFKIIDMKPERDLIHYVWTRFIALAGKVNLEGDLYMSKTIPYTVETLAIEFNRDINQIKLAIDVFLELEMIEITEHNAYRVKNFAKHQNIKRKDTIKPKDKEDNLEIHNTICDEKVDDDSKPKLPIILEEKKKKKAANSKSQKKNNNTTNDKNTNTNDEIDMDDGNQEDSLMQFYEGEEGRPLEDGECVIGAWSF